MVRLVQGHHAKYWLAGLAQGEVPRGILFSGDLSKRALQPLPEESTNSHELMLELLPDEAVELKEFARWVMQARPAFDVLPETTSPAAKSPIAAPPTLRRLLLTKPTKTIAANAQQLLRQAQTSITITAWRLDEDDAFVRMLAEKAGQLVVTVLAPATPDNRPALDFLAKRGAHVLACPGMHAKVILVDQNSSPLAMVSSANFMHEGMDVGTELGLKLGSDDLRLSEVRAFVDELIPHCPSVATTLKPKVAATEGSWSQQLSSLKLPVSKPLYQAE
jgi:phosphatidylserine/phosphatidylglycerophosphate/cardiolipin synthase-like enzyme